MLITYFYRVTNTGNVTLITTAADPNAAPLVCPRPVLPPGRSMTCRSYHVVTEADVDAGKIPNVGLATGKAPDGTEVHADDPLVIPTVHAPAISIVKTASVDSFAAAGTSVNYYYLVTNNGNTTLDPVTVTDSRGLPLRCPSTRLAVGQAMTCTARYVTTAANVNGGHVFNVATVRGRTPSGAGVFAASSAFVPFTPPAFVPVTG